MAGQVEVHINEALERLPLVRKVVESYGLELVMYSFSSKSHLTRSKENTWWKPHAGDIAYLWSYWSHYAIGLRDRGDRSELSLIKEIAQKIATETGLDVRIDI